MKSEENECYNKSMLKRYLNKHLKKEGERGGMRTSTNNTDVRRVNRNRVFRFINHTKETCMSEISSALEISGPTVMSIVKELKEAGVIREVGEYESTGGEGKRKQLPL